VLKHGESEEFKLAKIGGRVCAGRRRAREGRGGGCWVGALHTRALQNISNNNSLSNAVFCGRGAVQVIQRGRRPSLMMMASCAASCLRAT
jgi:hypothetical protein